jgi:hypothetical protein
MFTAKDALYESMAYTDKKTGGSPSPTPTTSPFYITLTQSGESSFSVDKTVDEIYSAYTSGKLIYLILENFEYRLSFSHIEILLSCYEEDYNYDTKALRIQTFYFIYNYVGDGQLVPLCISINKDIDSGNESVQINYLDINE